MFLAIHMNSQNLTRLIYIKRHMKFYPEDKKTNRGGGNRRKNIIWLNPSYSVVVNTKVEQTSPNLDPWPKYLS